MTTLKLPNGPKCSLHDRAIGNIPGNLKLNFNNNKKKLKFKAIGNLPGGSQAWLSQWITSFFAHRWVSQLECPEHYWCPAAPKWFAPRKAQKVRSQHQLPFCPLGAAPKGASQCLAPASPLRIPPALFKATSWVVLVAPSPQICLAGALHQLQFSGETASPLSFALPSKPSLKWGVCLPLPGSDALQGNTPLPLALPLWTWCPWSLQKFAGFLSPSGLRTVHWTVGKCRSSLWSLPCLLFQRACSHRWLQSLFIQISTRGGKGLVFRGPKSSPPILPYRLQSYLQKAESVRWAHLTALSSQPHCDRVRQWSDPRKYLKTNLE